MRRRLKSFYLAKVISLKGLFERKNLQYRYYFLQMIENLNRNIFFSAIKIISLGQSFPREYFLTPQVNQEKYPYFKLFNGARFLHENFIIEDVYLFIEKKIYYFSNTIRKDIVNGSNIKKRRTF